MAGRRALMKNEEEHLRKGLTGHSILVKTSEKSNHFIALKDLI